MIARPVASMLALVAVACLTARAVDGEPTWWSLRPLVKPAVAAVGGAGQGRWARTPIDLFIAA
ncbi:MAG TPA: hypothetical protein VKE94_18115, partial [Gemmataceae bacterium]|nr:hypothetical protein [Gemmataceae bacterium]